MANTPNQQLDEEMKTTMETGIVPPQCFFGNEGEHLDKAKVAELVEKYKEIVDKILEETPRFGSSEEKGPRIKKRYPYVTMASSSRTFDSHRMKELPELGSNLEDNEKLIKNLFYYYDDGIAGYGVNYAEVSDEQLYKLMREVLEENLRRNGTDNPDLIYFSLYSLFPKSFSQRQLSEIFPDLCEKFAEEGFNWKMLEPWKQECGDEEPAPCVECRTRMCAFHGVIKENTPVKNAEHYVSFPLFDEAEPNPCSSSCWKHVSRERVDAVLKPTESDRKAHQVPIVLNNKDIEEVDDIASKICANMFLGASKMPFCEFFGLTIQGIGKLKTCADAYQFILSLSRRQERFENKRTRKPDDKNRNFKKLFERERRKDPKKTVLAKGPCSHEGKCSPDNKDCRCGDGFCSFLCTCGPDCLRAFPGCKCGPGKCGNGHCPCFRANWECNPETCHGCGDESGCPNTGVTRMAEKKLYLGPAGTGLFAGEKLKKGEFVVEYVGELISDEEAERRALLSAHSYLYDTLTGGSIDAAQIGNKARCANHSSTPTLEVRHIAAMGTMRIAFYAMRDIDKGEELTINYV